MRKLLLEYLVCPVCQSKFDLTSSKQNGEHTIEGQLTCQKSHHSFPIFEGIPRLLMGLDQQLETAQAFGWEWQKFTKLHDSDDIYTELFLDWIDPIQPDFFKQKIVLDAGCGMGRFALVASDFGAQEVLAIDISKSVLAARMNTIHRTNIHVIQADIYHLPFRSGPQSQIDFTYSIGVLHHLPDPEAGFRSLIRHIKPRGAIFGWVYGQENNEWITRFVNPLREQITSRIPKRILYFLSFLFTLVLQPILRLLYSDKSPRPPWLKTKLPYRSYLEWLSQFGFRHNHSVVFDHLVAPKADYISKPDFLGWFERAHLNGIWVSSRNQNSWRGFGILPASIPKIIEK